MGRAVLIVGVFAGLATTVCDVTRGGGRRGRRALASMGLAGCALLFPAGAAAASAPAIESESVTQIDAHSATVEAQINPEDQETSYQFWLRYAICQSPPAVGPCQGVAIAQVGEGVVAATDASLRVTATLGDLQPGYSYTYFVVATNATGTTQGEYRAFRAAVEGSHEPEGKPLLPPEAAPTGQPNNYNQPYVNTPPPEWVNQLAREMSERAVAAREAEELAKRRESEAAASLAASATTDAQMSGKSARQPTHRSTKLCVVPELQGDSLRVASSALKRAHCRLGKVSAPAGSGGVLIVTRQSRPRGRKLPTGSSIALELGRLHRGAARSGG
ncbi:MAG TPA: hypothetical protein VMS02_04110 [Solirubrobacteraceae bacterium]|nr:hypothetical protein [Solirubrobacteraceae bacterium]